MNKKILSVFSVLILLTISLSGCQEQNNEKKDLIDNYTSDKPFLQSMLNHSINLAGNYLGKIVDHQGIFVYEYVPTTQTKSTENYNILRHAGTIYSMIKIYNQTKEGNLLDSIERSIDYLLNQVKSYNNTLCIVYNDEVKLGGTALAIIALVEYIKVTNNEKHLQTIQNLGEYILLSQKSTGEFIHKRYYSTNETSTFISEYYPGEAILSLCRLYSITKNPKWLQAAENATQYLITVRDAEKTIQNLTHDHWLLLALNELYRYQKNPLYYHHSRNITSAILSYQRNDVTRLSEKQEWLGSYYTPPRSTPTATRSEGLLASYHLFKDFKENQTFINRLTYAINLSIHFQIQMQYTNQTIEELDFPAFALGGFKESIEEYTIRIDYVQHNICSIIDFYNIILKDETFLQSKEEYENRLKQTRLNYAILEESINKGSQYLINNQKEEGNFNYEYDWISKTKNNDDNEVRQAGALWGIALLYKEKQGEDLLETYLNGYEFFKSNTIQGNDNQQWISYPNSNFGKTGTIALVCLSLIDFLRSSHPIEENLRLNLESDLDKYLNFLISLRTNNGLFHEFYHHHNGTGFGSSSPYFDGESLLALCKAYNYVQKTEFKSMIIETAYKTYQSHIIEALQKDADSSITKGFFQWGIMSYYEILKTDWENMQNYSTVIIGLADWMIDVHKTLQRTRNTAYAYEGIIHAYDIAKEQLDAYHVQKFKEVIDIGLYKLTSWQVGGPIPNEYIQNHPTSDPLAIGGIMNHKQEPGLRVDVTQHQMHAAILAKNYVYNC